MASTKESGDAQVRCENCSQLAPSYDIINVGSMEKGYRKVCHRCFNAETATICGLAGFENAKLQPVCITDCNGEVHEFHFRTFLYIGLALEAFELRDGNPGGYQFQIIGEPEDDVLVLLGRLIERIRRALSVKHLEDGEFGLQIAKPGIVRGGIDSDLDSDEDSRLPLLNIDGEDITWSEFGRMLMTYEGFHFRLHIVDKSEET